MPAPRRKPTIRRVRDWEPGSSTAPLISAAISASLSSSLRAPRVPLDLLPPPSSSSRETAPTMPIARPYYEGDEDEEEKATLARFVPINSEVRALFEDPEETLAYIRKAQASLPDTDAALDSLVAVYEDRVARLAKQREHAAEVLVQKKIVVEEKARETARPKKNVKPLDRAVVKLQPHLWKIVYSTICVWGLLQLALTR
jgi:hypothetical protein